MVLQGANICHCVPYLFEFLGMNKWIPKHLPRQKYLKKEILEEFPQVIHRSLHKIKKKKRNLENTELATLVDLL